ncbi:DUF3318 domain-containing protein [Spirulina major CS-329]|uniref:DUF3318 domain-containing protein n=1 Tax=Spirulina TaxID=1154 RepID=UPI00232AE449|nr:MULTISPECIES: DUF3318 domain-containing protein [Spirulina]MDB9493282.1 DUF3318 domain-containing protein [Spirulina subsalsa CS-330]MDB9504288.1 DUF3318 domain-containing protein [Spirulina major CS-329]
MRKRRGGGPQPASTAPHIQDEIRRLRELMPASGRMLITIAAAPQQPEAIAAPFPSPWRRDRFRITLNFARWLPLPQAQRDLLLLRAVTWQLQGRGVQVKGIHGLVALGVVGTGFEWVQHNAVGVVVAGGLTAIALRRAWRDYHGPERDLDADAAALQVAERRGYSLPAAAEHLYLGLEAIAAPHPNGIELLRIQTLRAIAHRPPI